MSWVARSTRTTVSPVPPQRLGLDGALVHASPGRLLDFERVAWPAASATWQVQVRRTVDEIADEVELHRHVVRTPRASCALQRLQDALRGARAHVGEPMRWRDWWNGVAIESAWADVHQAQALLAMMVAPEALPSQLAQADRVAARYLPSDDSRRVALGDKDLRTRIQQGGQGRGVPDGDRFVVFTAVQAAYSEADVSYASLRGLRNRLWMLAGIALVALVTIVAILLHELAADAEPFRSLVGADSTPGVIPVAIATAGALGAFVTGLTAMRKTQPTTATYSVMPALTALRIPSGAIAALVGALLVQNGLVPTVEPFESLSALAALALVLGASQEIVVGLLDKHARAIESAATNGSSSQGDSRRLVGFP